MKKISGIALFILAIFLSLIIFETIFIMIETTNTPLPFTGWMFLITIIISAFISLYLSRKLLKKKFNQIIDIKKSKEK